tara:strand:+ start:425 stop:631 length:207 start_codon:yes stop_codon:yes gene_type:complete
MYKLLNIITGLIGIIFIILFLLGITLTLDKSRYISFLDILPVWIIMLAVIFMLCLDFFNSTKDKNKDE